MTNGADSELEILMGSVILCFAKLKTLPQKLPPASCKHAEGQDHLLPGRRRKRINKHPPLKKKHKSFSSIRVHLFRVESGKPGCPGSQTSLQAAGIALKNGLSHQIV